MTEQTFYPFPSIGQFRNIVHDVQHIDPTAKLWFQGTVKVHGTQGAIVIEPDGAVRYQSRSRIITPEDDNMGFAAWAEERRSTFTKLRREDVTAVLLGEFAGEGIQKSVAVSKADKFFYVFAAAVYDEKDRRFAYGMMPNMEDDRVVLASCVPYYEIEIDFAHPEASTNELARLTEGVEKECPVGKYLGVSGTGEGIVWSHMTNDRELLMFKVKGQKHSISKVKKLAQVDPEKVASVEVFVDYAVTDARLSQGFQEACNGDPDRTKLGAFLKWVNTDIHKEESDVLAESNLTTKDVARAVSGKAREWFFAKEEF